MEEYPQAYRMRLDVGTGICVLIEPIGGSRPGSGHDLGIEAVDEPMADELFRTPPTPRSSTSGLPRPGMAHRPLPRGGNRRLARRVQPEVARQVLRFAVMERVGVRETRQIASRYLALVKASKTVEVAERGQLIALSPPEPRESVPSLREDCFQKRADRT